LITMDLRKCNSRCFTNNAVLRCATIAPVRSSFKQKRRLGIIQVGVSRWGEGGAWNQKVV